MALSIEPNGHEHSATKMVTTHFERFEIKFWVTEAIAERVALASAPFVDLDPWSRPGVLTRNVSLYLDSRDLRFWGHHANGAPARDKLRVRGYGDPPKGDAFFEVKRKVKALTLKTRARIPMECVRDALAGRIDRNRCAPEELSYLENFVYIATMHRVEPQVLVAGYRQAFVSRAGDDVRMTMDRELMYQPATRGAFDYEQRNWRAIPGPMSARSWLGKPCVLIEMKFPSGAPPWMAEIIGRFGLQREAYSKYVAAIEHLYGWTR